MKLESGRYADQMAAGLHVAYERDASERVNRISSIPFALVHLVPFASSGPASPGATVRGLVVGFFLSTVLLWHGTFLVNSIAHVFGRRRYVTHDSSRNSLLIALVTGGEGWHNNHHYLPSSTRQGFFWRELDFTYYALLGLRVLRIVRDLHRPPARLMRMNLVRDRFDIGMFEAHLARAGGILTAACGHVSDSYDRARVGVATTIRSSVAAAEDLAHQAKTRPA